MRLRIVDEEGNDVEDGQVGELLLNGPGITSGYWNDEQATAESFTKDGVWFKTGDRGHERNGKLYIVDRKKGKMMHAPTASHG
jgi:long-subunit acyl-CoA synthetase (AMP-forming)